MQQQKQCFPSSRKDKLLASFFAIFVQVKFMIRNETNVSGFLIFVWLSQESAGVLFLPVTSAELEMPTSNHHWCELHEISPAYSSNELIILWTNKLQCFQDDADAWKKQLRAESIADECGVLVKEVTLISALLASSKNIKAYLWIFLTAKVWDFDLSIELKMYPNPEGIWDIFSEWWKNAKRKTSFGKRHHKPAVACNWSEINQEGGNESQKDEVSPRCVYRLWQRSRWKLGACQSEILVIVEDKEQYQYCTESEQKKSVHDDVLDHQKLHSSSVVTHSERPSLCAIFYASKITLKDSLFTGIAETFFILCSCEEECFTGSSFSVCQKGDLVPQKKSDACSQWLIAAKIQQKNAQRNEEQCVAKKD